MTTHLTSHSRDIREHARQLGLAAMLMLQDKDYSEYQILCLGSSQKTENKAR